MGIFYSPPPQAGRTAVTPPEPHVPIGTQGNPPPRYTTAVMLVAVLASWPQDLEPRLQKPNNEQQKIAPLTLSYGQQPAPNSRATFYETAGAWPPELVLTQGPPRSIAVLPPLASFVPWTSPPGLIWTAWVEPFVSPPRPVAIAPLTVTYGQAPIPQALWSGADIAHVVASWPSDVGPSLPWSRPPSIVGTFPTVSQPQVQPPLAVVELAQIVATWAQTWDAQTAPKGAAWNVPPLLTVLPHVPVPSAIWTAWEPPFLNVPRPVAIAPLTLVYGNQPPAQPPLARTVAGIIIPAWPADLEPRLGRPNAERTRIVPLTFTYGTSPIPRGPLSRAQMRVISGTWEPPFVAPPELVAFTTGLVVLQRVSTANLTSLDAGVRHSIHADLLRSLANPLTYAEATVELGASASWRLDDSTGLVLLDAIGSRPAAFSSLTGVTFKVAGALNDGTTGLATNGTTSGTATLASPIVTGNTFTVEAWIRPTQWSGSSATGFLLADAANGEGFYAARSSGTRIKAGYQSSAAGTQSVTPLTQGTLYHWVLSVSAGVGTWYINGVPDGSDAGLASSSLDTLFGASGSGALSASLIDEIAFFPVALTAQQAADRYQLATATMTRRPRRGVVAVPIALADLWLQGGWMQDDL